ncbi:MAG: hypothetical protein CSA58_08525 [Micrococcales bacterium]|nr:MAG: hypothetical protein CSB46_06925 [Micrococcales bacterium]PIE26604.1 MAG: hypothetical protein CSA58_08525 [Micrococcales bacterium]
MSFGQAHDAATSVLRSVESVIRGRGHAVRMLGCALFSGGHALIEDVPGSGKTTLARAFARSIGGDFSRIQATADLLPADITGASVWEGTLGGAGAFRFLPGPVFANVVLVDELNRTSARTQSALLEAMDEHAVTVDGSRYPLPDPFFLIATQNPVEHHGTFHLPEAQLDRFTVTVRLGQLDLPTELEIVRSQLVTPTVDSLSPVVGSSDLAGIRQLTRTVHVADATLHHAVTLATSTRHDARVRLGASPRAAIALVRAAQAHALLAGRNYVTPDDTKAVAVNVLAHRIAGFDADPRLGYEVVQAAVNTTPVLA